MGEAESLNPGAASVALQRAALAMVVANAFGNALMLSSVTVALPSIARAFALDAVLLAWVPLIFLMTSAATVLAFGRLADMYGRKRMFVFGASAFALSSILLAFAPDAPSLIGLRAFQGIGAAMLYATQTAILTSVYPPQQRGRVLGWLAASVYFGLTCGPLIGGWLVEQLGWRAAFVAHLPFTLLVLLVALPRVRGEWAAERRGRFDWQAALLYAAAIICLMLGVAALPKFHGLAGMAGGLALMLVFLRHQHGRADPLLNVSLLLGNRVFGLSSLAALLMYTTTFSILVLISLYLQYLKGLAPTGAGLVMLAQPLMVALVSPAAGRISDRLEPRLLASAGIALTALGLFLLSRLGPATPLVHLVGCLLLTGTGFGLFGSPNVSAIMGAVGRGELGQAGGTVATMRILGQLCSMGIVAIAFALTIGQVEITPDTYPALARALELSFLVAAALCLPATLCSLARGRVRAAS
ncbi:MAG TPA: MFS transporter [Gammaproteobacteria bacterium]|nr:MFS transporter [Gammaproteobacteria bacterium]